MQDADFRLIEAQLARRIPVPCGTIHPGPVGRSTGSGHWLLVAGHTLNANRKGASVSIARTTATRACGYGRRWMVEPIGGGASRHTPGKGWAVVVDGVA